jgi:hypothetical protein
VDQANDRSSGIRVRHQLPDRTRVHRLSQIDDIARGVANGDRLGRFHLPSVPRATDELAPSANGSALRSTLLLLTSNTDAREADTHRRR